MAEYALGGCLQRTVEVLKKNSDFMKAKRSLDLGGGHGLYSIAFSRLNPELEAFIFDLPTVIDEFASEIVSVCDGKVKLLSGDMTKDDLGSDYDVSIRFRSSLRTDGFNQLNPEKDKCQFKGGRDLISKHFHQDEISKDMVSVFFDLMFSLTRGMDHGIYPTGELCHIIESNGFSVVQIEDISTFSSPTKIIIAKKVR